MHHSKAEILRGLDPTNPATIQALIDHHRLTFGGWKMEGEEDGEPKEEDVPEGAAQKSALQQERDARKAAEDALAELAGAPKSEVRRILNGLASEPKAISRLNRIEQGLRDALGVSSEEKTSTEDIVSNLQQKFAAMEHSNLVLTVASTHKITDEDDLGLLLDFKGDEAGLRKLAARLKPSEEKDDASATQKRRTPAPDPSQGRGSGSEAGRPSSVKQVMAERAAARAAASK